MNNIITSINIDSPKTDLELITSTANTDISGFDAVETGASAFTVDSFHQTMQEALAQSLPDSETVENGLTGNDFPQDLPITNVFSQLTAENDPPLASIINKVTDLLDVKDKPLSSIMGSQLVTDKLPEMSSVGNIAIVDHDVIARLSSSSPSSLALALEISLTTSSSKPSAEAARVLESSIQQSMIASEDHEKFPSFEKRVTQGITQGIITQEISHKITQTGSNLVTESLAKSSPGSLAQQQSQLNTQTLSANKIINSEAVNNTVEAMFDEPLVETPIQSMPAKKTDEYSIIGINKPQNAALNILSKQSAEYLQLESQDEIVTSDDVLFDGKQRLPTPYTVNTAEQLQSKSHSSDLSLFNIKQTNFETGEVKQSEVGTLSSIANASLSVDEDVKVVTTINMLSSQLRMQVQSKAGFKIAQGVGVNASANNVKTSVKNLVTKINITALEASSMKSSDTMPLLTELPTLMTEKIQTLSNMYNNKLLSTSQFTTSQPATTELSSLPASLLQPSATPVTVINESVLGITTPSLVSLNSLSNINLQPVAQTEIADAFGRTSWSRGMGKQVLSMINQNIGSAEIRLNPAHLGPIEILIDMSEDQVNVSLSSRHAIVREAMEQALPRLREMLDENGFSLADTDISKHSFAEQREQNSDNREKQAGIDESSKHSQNLSSEINQAAIQHASKPSGTVDYFV